MDKTVTEAAFVQIGVAFQQLIGMKNVPNKKRYANGVVVDYMGSTQRCYLNLV